MDTIRLFILETISFSVLFLFLLIPQDNSVLQIYNGSDGSKYSAYPATSRAEEAATTTPTPRSNRTRKLKLKMAPPAVRAAWGEKQLREITKWLDPLNRQLDLPTPGVETPIFVAIDVEKWECGRQDIIITEVGVSVLDPENLQGWSLDNNAIDWQEGIETRHLRIKENSRKKFINYKYRTGCPDNFLFGTSEFVHLADVPGILNTIIFDATFKENALRPVVLVGHAVHNDVRDMQVLGWSPDEIQNHILTVDTQFLALACGFREKLEYPTDECMGEWPAYCHNAGNDAHYTMIDMMMMGVRDYLNGAVPDLDVAMEEPEVTVEEAVAVVCEKVKAKAVYSSWAAVVKAPAPPKPVENDDWADGGWWDGEGPMNGCKWW